MEILKKIASIRDEVFILVLMALIVIKTIIHEMTDTDIICITILVREVIL